MVVAPLAGAMGWGRAASVRAYEGILLTFSIVRKQFPVDLEHSQAHEGWADVV
jgi:hypothetical protein